LMPSLLHEGLIALIREKPEFAAGLLREILHVDVPRFTEARLAEASLNELVPAEYHADAVVLFVDGKPVFGSVFEAQLQEDDRKRFTWPAYAVNARARFGCPFVLVVIAPDAATARWAAKPIALGGGQSWSPRVVGPEGIPIITDTDHARRNPELAVLSLIAHGKGDTQVAVSIAVAATAALDLVSKDQQVLYSALIASGLSIAARKAFEMHPQTEKLISDWQRASFEKGRIAEKAADVLEVLEARGLAVSGAQREVILGCSDLETLKRWHRRAVTVAATDTLFE
jgi:hypothetical protein